MESNDYQNWLNKCAALSDISEEEALILVAETKAGNEAAATSLVEHYTRMVLKICDRLKPPRFLYEDMCQECFLALLETAGDYDLENSNHTFAAVAYTLMYARAYAFLVENRLPIKIPVATFRLAGVYKHKVDFLKEYLGKDTVSDADVFLFLGISGNKKRTLDFINSLRIVPLTNSI